MADTMGQPVKALKKKKPLAFLSSTPRPAPIIDFSDDDGKHKKDDDDDLDLFRRSKDFFPVVVKEQEEPREVTPEHGKQDRKHDVEESTATPSPRSSKRRKMSSPPCDGANSWESHDALYGPATPPRRASESFSETSIKSHVTQSPPSEEGKSKKWEDFPLLESDILPTPSRSNSNQPFADEVVPADDDLQETTPNEDVRNLFKKEESSPGPILLEDSDDDLIETIAESKEDDPFDHFVQRAREREATAKATRLSNADDEFQTPDGAKQKESISSVKIFVYSRLSKYPDIKPVGVCRGLNQDLGVVREVFVKFARGQGAGLSENEVPGIFLSWKGRRIYDVSTGDSLGWSPSADGEFHTPARTPGFTKGGVLLEAWTEEDFQQYTAEEERRKLIDRGELMEDLPDDEAAEELQAEKIRIALKEKDKEPFKMSVYADTQVRIVASAYRKLHKIPDDREIKLRYEGEWLDPKQTVQDADIEDLCTVEVYIK